MNEENKNIKPIETLSYKPLLFTGGSGWVEATCNRSMSAYRPHECCMVFVTTYANDITWQVLGPLKVYFIFAFRC